MNSNAPGPADTTAQVHRSRMTARLDGDFVVFLIGMRLNKPWQIHKWWPVASAMPRMLKELHARPELGFLHAEMWLSRTVLMVQYWRSVEDLLAYAKAKDSAHLPAWQAFNRSIGTDGSVGIWHETYQAGAGTYENVYVNMPPFGLGRAGMPVEAKGDLKSADGRFKAASRGGAYPPEA